MFSAQRIGTQAIRAIKHVTTLEGSTASLDRSIVNVAKRRIMLECLEDEERKEHKETRNRQKAESVVQSAVHTHARNFSTSTNSSPSYVSDRISEDVPRGSPDGLARMADALSAMGACSLRSHRLMANSAHIQWDNVVQDVRSHTDSISSRSKGLFSLSALGCSLVGLANICGPKGFLPNIMQVVGESIKLGKSSIESVIVDCPRSRFQSAKELYMNSINQVGRSLEHVQSTLDQTTQQLQQLEDKRAQEVQAILSGRS